MIGQPPRSTLTHTLLPHPTLVRSVKPAYHAGLRDATSIGRPPKGLFSVLRKSSAASRPPSSWNASALIAPCRCALSGARGVIFRFRLNGFVRALAGTRRDWL